MSHNIRLKSKFHSLKYFISLKYFQDFHPYSLILYFSGIFAGVFKIGSMPFGAGSAAAMIWVMISLAVLCTSVKGAAGCLKLLLFGSFTGIFIIIITLFTTHGSVTPDGSNVFLYVNDIPLTYDALYSAITSVFTILSLLLLFSAFSVYIDSSRVTFLLGRFFPSAAIIISMIYCFTNRYRTVLDTVRDSGRQFNIAPAGNIIRRMKNGAYIYSCVTGIMLENSLDTAASMNARGFNLTKKRFSRYRIRTKDILLIAASSLFLCYAIFFMTRWSARGLYMALYIIFPVIFNIISAIITIRRRHLWK